MNTFKPRRNCRRSSPHAEARPTPQATAAKSWKDRPGLKTYLYSASSISPTHISIKVSASLSKWGIPELDISSLCAMGQGSGQMGELSARRRRRRRHRHLEIQLHIQARELYLEFVIWIWVRGERDIWEWRPGIYTEFRYKSLEHSGLAWGAILRKVFVLTLFPRLPCLSFQEHVPEMASFTNVPRQQGAFKYFQDHRLLKWIVFQYFQDPRLLKWIVFKDFQDHRLLELFVFQYFQDPRSSKWFAFQYCR